MPLLAVVGMLSSMIDSMNIYWCLASCPDLHLMLLCYVHILDLRLGFLMSRPLMVGTSVLIVMGSGRCSL